MPELDIGIPPARSAPEAKVAPASIPRVLSSSSSSHNAFDTLVSSRPPHIPHRDNQIVPSQCRESKRLMFTGQRRLPRPFEGMGIRLDSPDYFMSELRLKKKPA